MNYQKHKYCIYFDYHLIGVNDRPLESLCILRANSIIDAINELLINCYNLDYQLINIKSIERLY